MPKQKHLIIVSDAWEPQVNGVVNTLRHMKREVERRGHKVSLITPDLFQTVSLPVNRQIHLPIWTRSKENSLEEATQKAIRRFFYGDTTFSQEPTIIGTVAQMLEKLKPDQIYIATEGPLGQSAAAYCKRYHLTYTSGVHTQFQKYAPKYAETYAKTRGIPFGNRAKSLTESIAYHVMHKIHDSAKHTLVTTRSLQDEFAKHGFKHMRLWLRGVDTDAFHPGKSDVYKKIRERFKGGETLPIFLYVGRVAPDKEIENFLKCELPGIKVVVGPGEEKYLTELKKIAPDAVFVGEIKHGDLLAQYYRGADVFVFPSKFETFGQVQTEALACGIPIAAYSGTMSEEIIKPPDRIGKPPIAVTDTDLGKAALDALALKKTPDCSQNCYDFVKERYSWEKTADIFEQHLEDIAGKNSCRGTQTQDNASKWESIRTAKENRQFGTLGGFLR